MKKLLAAGLLGASLVVPSTSALAGGYHNGHHGGHYGGYHGRHHGHIKGSHLLAAAGFIGGALVIGSALSQPRYNPPPRTYYQPAPSYRPTCVNDEVWRRLPDGRIQTGVRTRCY